ncbi:hypothetical protein [Streptomyces sp. DH8]|uniref:DUF7683 domain-containing protein n=1 Tax=Streptomyces sp. DH8 TaxID=2857008 RepID=UPI001E52E8C4|nr:hypothetical protein [Streptomyces sp. DH8]
MMFVIASYRKEADRPDGDVDVSEAGAEFFAEILGMSVEALTDVYPLSESQAQRISARTGMVFDFSTHEYFLEALAD